MGFDGAWDLTVNSPMGAKQFRLDVTTEEGKVAGTASMGGEAMALVDPSVADGHLRWTMKLTRPMNITLEFDVTCDGDTLAGSAKAGFMTLPGIAGVRAAGGRP
jgi:hypothetical protein